MFSHCYCQANVLTKSSMLTNGMNATTNSYCTHSVLVQYVRIIKRTSASRNARRCGVLPPGTYAASSRVHELCLYLALHTDVINTRRITRDVNSMTVGTLVSSLCLCPLLTVTQYATETLVLMGKGEIGIIMPSESLKLMQSKLMYAKRTHPQKNTTKKQCENGTRCAVDVVDLSAGCFF